jgi:hypothetical protein
MPRSNSLVAVRAYDLEPGQRVRLPGERRLSTVLDVDTEAHPTLVIRTDDSTYRCESCDLIDAQEDSEVCA